LDVLTSDEKLDEFVNFVQEPIHKWLFIRAAWKARTRDPMFAVVRDYVVPDGFVVDVEAGTVWNRDAGYLLLRLLLGKD
jgi:hypothetical protein